MITSIAIKAALGNVGGFLKAIPWPIYIGIAAIFIVWAAYAKGASDKNKEWIDRLEQAEIAAQKKSDAAATKADTEQAKDTQEFETRQSELQKVIDDAKKNDVNPIDALLGGL